MWRGVMRALLIGTADRALQGLFLVTTLVLAGCSDARIEPIELRFEEFAAVGEVNPRFLGYNVEMVELTGGRFWAPYENGEAKPYDERFEYLPPIDLTNERILKLAAALGPSYVRFSGTWANATWFADTDSPNDQPPSGFDAVLTRQQWGRAVAFARDVDADIVVSMATSAGARDANGVWEPTNAQRLIDYTTHLGAAIAAAEFANEPNMTGLIQPPEGYTAADYRRDYRIFSTWLRQASPGTRQLAPGVVEMGQPMRTLSAMFSGMLTIPPAELLTADLPTPDAISFHYYGASSQRCHVPLLGSQKSDALDSDWLAGIDEGIARISKLRDQIDPALPLWNTESGETACGGNPWATTFLDSFRFVDQLARSAKQGVEVFTHNTLAASDYALLDEHTFLPRPNYWAAWMWRSLMGSVVLDIGQMSGAENIYAHCHRRIPGMMTILAINLSDNLSRTLRLPVGGDIYTLTQGSAGWGSIALNGDDLALANNDQFPELRGVPFSFGDIVLPPMSINFLVTPAPSESFCQ